MKGLKWMKDPLKRCNFQKSMELFVGFVCSNAQSHLKRFKVGRNPPNPSRFVALFHYPQSLSGCVYRPMPDQSLNHRKFIRWKKNSVEKSPQRLAFFPWQYERQLMQFSSDFQFSFAISCRTLIYTKVCLSYVKFEFVLKLTDI